MSTIPCNITKKCVYRKFVIFYLGKFYYLYEPEMTIEQAHKKIKEHIVYIEELFRKTVDNTCKNICEPGMLPLYTDAKVVCHEEEPEIPDKPKCFEDGGPDDPYADLYEK